MCGFRGTARGSEGGVRPCSARIQTHDSYTPLPARNVHAAVRVYARCRRTWWYRGVNHRVPPMVSSTHGVCCAQHAARDVVINVIDRDAVRAEMTADEHNGVEAGNRNGRGTDVVQDRAGDGRGGRLFCASCRVIAYLSMGASNAVAASCTCRCADLLSLCTMPISFIQPPPWLPIPPECHMIAASPMAKHHTILENTNASTIIVKTSNIINIILMHAVTLIITRVDLAVSLTSYSKQFKWPCIIRSLGLKRNIYESKCPTK